MFCIIGFEQEWDVGCRPKCDNTDVIFTTERSVKHMGWGREDNDYIYDEKQNGTDTKGKLQWH